MKGIAVTEKNYKQVCGKLEKFFAHRHFREWHRFRGGMKKRISHKTGVVFSYNRPDVYVENKIRDAKTEWLDGRFCVRYDNGSSSFCISVGDEILFCGNRVIIKQKDCIFNEYGCYYTYMCFQIDNHADINEFVKYDYNDYDYDYD